MTLSSTWLNVEATVFAVLPAYSQALLRDADGRQYAATATAAGTPWNALREGQRVRAHVDSLGRVLHIEPVP